MEQSAWWGIAGEQGKGEGVHPLKDLTSVGSRHGQMPLRAGWVGPRILHFGQAPSLAHAAPPRATLCLGGEDLSDFASDLNGNAGSMSGGPPSVCSGTLFPSPSCPYPLRAVGFLHSHCQNPPQDSLELLLFIF